MVDGTELGAAAPLSVDELEQELSKLVAEVEGYRERCANLADEIQALEDTTAAERLVLRDQLIRAQLSHIGDLQSMLRILSAGKS